MSFGASFSDLTEGIRICKWLYNHCFRVSAAAQYIEFGRDIQYLGNTLERLESTIRQRAPSYYDAEVWQEQQLERECSEIIGDFRRTLAECESFLKNNTNFQWSERQGIIVNLQWANVQSRVNELKDRTQFHARKIALVVSTLVLDTSTTIQRDVSEILVRLRQLQDGPLRIPKVPSSLASRFNSTLLIEAPPTFQNLSYFPLKEGFDALFWHFRRSTVTVAAPGDAKFEQTLNLLKCSWLLEILLESQTFGRLRAGSQYHRAILELGQRIQQQYVCGMGIANELDLLNLPDHCFNIWIPNTHPSTAPSCVDLHEEPMGLAIAMPQIPGYSVNNLLFYRKSLTVVNIVRERFLEGALHPDMVPGRVNIRKDFLIPWYAAPQIRHGSIRLEIRSGNETGGELYEFPDQNLDDALAFQRALTGYKVVFDQPNVSWALDRRAAPLSWFRSRMPTGTGRVQLWEWNPIDPTVSDVNIAGMDDQTTSDLSGNSNTTVSTAIKGCDPSIFSVVRSDGADNYEDSSTVIAAIKPHPPVLMIFTELDSQWTILHMERECQYNDIFRTAASTNFILPIVDETHATPAKSCECDREPLKCLHSSVERGSLSEFKVRKLSAHTNKKRESKFEEWNLLVFSRPPGEDVTPHEKLQSLPSFKVKFVELTFSNVSVRRSFNHEFRELIKRRRQKMKSFKYAQTQIAAFSDRSARSRSLRQASTMSSYNSASPSETHTSPSTQRPRISSVAISPVSENYRASFTSAPTLISDSPILGDAPALKPTHELAGHASDPSLMYRMPDASNVVDFQQVYELAA